MAVERNIRSPVEYNAMFKATKGGQMKTFANKISIKYVYEYLHFKKMQTKVKSFDLKK